MAMFLKLAGIEELTRKPQPALTLGRCSINESKVRKETSLFIRESQRKI